MRQMSLLAKLIPAFHLLTNYLVAQEPLRKVIHLAAKNLYHDKRNKNLDVIKYLAALAAHQPQGSHRENDAPGSRQ